MKRQYRIPTSLKVFYLKELSKAKKALDSNDYAISWNHLERAHILGQPYPWQHTVVHWKMLSFGVRIKNRREIFGQIPRLLFGGVKSFVGKIPTGNTGGSNVHALKSMPIAEDLLAIIESNRV